MFQNTQGRRRVHWTAGIVAAGVVVLLPVAYMAGWMAEMGQVRPVLSQLTSAQQALAQQQAQIPKEPPAQSPIVQPPVWGSTDVTLSWTSVPHATSYDVFRAVGDQSFSQAKRVGNVSQAAHTVVFEDSSVQPDTHYTYWIAPENAAGQGPLTAAVNIQTYMNWSMALAQAQSGAASVKAVAWSQGGLGLLQPAASAASPAAWVVGDRVYSPFTFSPSARDSTWFTKRWTSWKIGGHTATVSRVIDGISVLHRNGGSVQALTAGSMTPEDAAVWLENGKWRHEEFASSPEGLPDGALVINQYGQAAGITNASGQLIPFSSLT